MDFQIGQAVNLFRTDNGILVEETNVKRVLSGGRPQVKMANGRILTFDSLGRPDGAPFCIKEA